MPFLSTLAFAALHERAARAEALADAASRMVLDSEARFDRLFAEYTALRQRGADPAAGNSASVPTTVALPDSVLAELQEFIGDGDLYAHLRRYAEAELVRGMAPDVVATAIRFGQNAPALEETE